MTSSLEESLSLDYLNLLINGQAFSDVTFSVEGRLVHAHRCILAARSLFFRKFFYGSESSDHPQTVTGSASGARLASVGEVVPVNSVSYEVFLLLLQFIYSGQVSVVPHKHESRSNCGDRGCWHTQCSAAVDLSLDMLAAARYFGVEQLALLTQKHLTSMVEKASIEDVMKVLIASRSQEMHQLWTTCSYLVAKSGLPTEILAKHLPVELVAKVEELRLKSSIPLRSLMPHQHDLTSALNLEDQKIKRMRRALDSSDVELVKLMVMGEGLNLDESLALFYAVENCSREVVKALLELGAADVNHPAGPTRKTALHIAAEMVSPDMVAVLLDHHADPNAQTVDGITPLDILRTLTSDFLFKGAIPGLMTRLEPNKLRLCLELVQSAALVISREEGNKNNSTDNNPTIYPRMKDEHTSGSSLDSRLVYLNLGATNPDLGDEMSLHHHHHDPSTIYYHPYHGHHF
ncbi:Regulatory protein NPR6 [Hirschfeldia incana]|nr:Regulatory protein NPR6 [Hirschfeldia incana]